MNSIKVEVIDSKLVKYIKKDLKRIAMEARIWQLKHWKISLSDKIEYIIEIEDKVSGYGVEYEAYTLKAIFGYGQYTNNGSEVLFKGTSFKRDWGNVNTKYPYFKDIESFKLSCGIPHFNKQGIVIL